MSLLRAKQSILTSISPHNANRRFLIPRRKFKDTEPPAQGTVFIEQDPNGLLPTYYGFFNPQPPSASIPYGSITGADAYNTEIIGMNAALDNGDTESNIVIRFKDDLPPIVSPVLFMWGTESIELFVGQNTMSRNVSNPQFAQYIKDNEGNNLPFMLNITRSNLPIFLADENNNILEADSGALLFGV